MAEQESFAARLRRVREAGGHTRADLAEAAGMSEGAIRDYEQGKRSPSLEAAMRLALALGKPLALWEGCVGMTDGAFQLPSRPEPGETLDWGQYKGWRFAEMPTAYLEDLERTMRTRLTPKQRELLTRVLSQRESGRYRGERETNMARKAHQRAQEDTARFQRRSARMESEAKHAEARATSAEAERLAAEAMKIEAEARRAKAEDQRKRRQEQKLQGAGGKPKTKPKAEPLDDRLPGE